MELRQLRYVVAVAEERNFTAPAPRAHVASRPSASRSPRSSASSAPAPFERSSRGVALTPAGAAFLPHARAALAAATAGSDAVRTLRGELAGGAGHRHHPLPHRLARPPARRLRPTPPRRAGHAPHRRPRGPGRRRRGGSLDVAAVGVMGGRPPAGPAGKRLPAGLASQTIATEPPGRGRAARPSAGRHGGGGAVRPAGRAAGDALPGTGLRACWSPPAPRPASSPASPSTPTTWACWPTSWPTGWA